VFHSGGIDLPLQAIEIGVVIQENAIAGAPLGTAETDRKNSFEQVGLAGTVSPVQDIHRRSESSDPAPQVAKIGGCE